MKKFKYARHGDVTMQKIDKLPKEMADFQPVEVQKVVLALGEVTGHHHRVIPIDDAVLTCYAKDGKVEISDNMVIEVKNGKALLVHEEHEPILLEEGMHFKCGKRQFNPFTNSIEKVRD